jgi:uncharacterized protein YbaP (TraB family)
MRIALVIIALVACDDGGVGNELPSLVERQRLAAEVCPEITHPFLYRVERDGTTNYLFGTRHMSVALDKLPQFVRDTLFTQKLIVFETPDHEPKPDLSGAPVREALGAADWQRYRDIAGDRLADLVARKSVMVATISLIAKYENVEHLLDKEIRTHATELHLPNRGLETVQFQLDLLKKMMDVRALRVVLMAGSSNALRIAMMKSLGDYCIGREHGDFTAEGEVGLVAAGYRWSEIQDLEDTLLYARNRAWMPQLEQMFAAGNVAVVVGAGHLAGERGVPALLRAQGYTVTRVAP